MTGKVSSKPSDRTAGQTAAVGGLDRAVPSDVPPRLRVTQRAGTARILASVPPLPAQATASTVERTTGVTERRTGATS